MAYQAGGRSDDESSTEAEMAHLKEKLGGLEAMAQDQLKSNKSKRIIQYSLSSSDSGRSKDGDRSISSRSSKVRSHDTMPCLASTSVARRKMTVAEASTSKSIETESPAKKCSFSNDRVHKDPRSGKESPMRATPPPTKTLARQAPSLLVPRVTATRQDATTGTPDNGDDHSTTSTSFSSSSSYTSSSGSNSSTCSDDSSPSSDHESQDKKSHLADLVNARPSTIVTKQADKQTNPYTAGKPKSPVPPPTDTPAASPPPEPKDASAPAPQPPLEMDDYLLFFGDDSDLEMKVAESPHFVPESSRKNGSIALSVRGRSQAASPASEVDTPVGTDTDAATEEADVLSKQAMTRPAAKTANLPVQNVQAPELNLEAEIDPSLYSPPPFKAERQAVLHKFNETNRPIAKRTKIPVLSLFQPPVSQFWHGSFEQFNPMQSELANPLCQSNDHMIVSAPTGAGKTAVFEMAMAKFIRDDIRAQNRARQRYSRNRKMVYIAPSKALCEERLGEWTRRLASTNLGIQVAMVTGDSDEPGAWFHDLSSAHLILVTPEKWDSITRKWTENFFLLATVKLIMVDEVHLLGDDSRGPCLEAILTRMKTIQRAAVHVNSPQEGIQTSSFPHTTPEAIASSLRVVAVSATLPNITDVADFVGASEAYAFDGSFRPVPLTKHVSAFGYVGKNEFKFWSTLDQHIPQLIHRFSGGKQTLVFCHTKGETERLSATLVQHSLGNKKTEFTDAPPGTLNYCLAKGVAYHHGGLRQEDRNRIEQAFLAGKISCLCATSTLAVGVNLPARLVIVKGTRTWRGGGNGYQDIDKTSLLQMIGRAGRPGLDTTGIAVIMTDNKSKSLVEHQVQGLGPAESRLLPKLVDVLNTEISHQVIHNMDSALQWLKTTFLFERITQEPAKYAMSRSWQNVDAYLRHLLERTFRDLVDANLVAVRPSGAIEPLPACHVMSHKMVPFESAKLITSLPYDASKCQILKALSKMETFNTNVRRNEKRFLNECHKDERIRFKLDGQPSKIRIQQPWEKTFVLLQAFIGKHSFDNNFGLAQQMTAAGSNALRLLSAAQEYCTKGSRHGYVALMCLKLRRSLHFSLWEKESPIFNQLDKIGYEVALCLQRARINTFRDILGYSEQELERLTKQHVQLWTEIKAVVLALERSRLKLSASVTFTRGSNMAADVCCDLTLADPATAALSNPSKNGVQYTLLAFTDQPGSCLVFRESITAPGSYRFAPPTRFGKLFIHLVASLISLDESLVIEGNDKVAPPAFINTRDGQNRHSPDPTTTEDDPRIKKPDKSLHQKSVRSMLEDQRLRDNDKKNDQAGRITIENTSVQRNTTSPSPCSVIGSKSHKEALVSRPRKPTNSSRLCSNVGSNKNIVMPKSHKYTSNTESSQLACSILPGVLHAKHETTAILPNVHASRRQQTAAYIPAFQNEKTVRVATSTMRNDHESMVPDETGIQMPPYAPRTVMITPASSTGRTPYSSPVPNDSTQCLIPNSRKRGQANAWTTSQKKQQCTQQRAFASRRDNPFEFFQHDPNDAESFLEDLSHKNHQWKGSIIPEQELLNFPCGNKRPGRVARSNNYRSLIGKDRRRLKKSRNIHRVSDRDVLRLKAQEASEFALNSMSPRQGSPYLRQTVGFQYEGQLENGDTTMGLPSPFSDWGPEDAGLNQFELGSYAVSEQPLGAINNETYYHLDSNERGRTLDSYPYHENSIQNAEIVASHPRFAWSNAPIKQQLPQYSYLSHSHDPTFTLDGTGWHPEYDQVYQPYVAFHGRPLPQEEAFLNHGYH